MLRAAAAADGLVGLDVGADAEAGLGERLPAEITVRFLQCVQSLRARRWATTQSSAEAVRKLSMPIFCKPA